MKILKLIKRTDSYYVIFDKIPKLTYEKIGADYIGSSVNSKGEIISSRFLKRERFGDAFAGSEIKLNMKDGSLVTIKDYWFDHGSYREHGDFIHIAVGTVKELQKCYVYSSYTINREAFEKMVDEYLSREKLYDYREVEAWCNLQYKWYDVIVNGKKIPYMMNKFGTMVERESKKRVSAATNKTLIIKGIFKELTFFRFSYMDNGTLIKIDANYLDTLKSTFPFTEEEIKINCGID